MTEEWRPVRGFEGYYSISSSGEVRSEYRVITHSNGRHQTIPERKLKHVYNKGYPFVNLFIGGKKKSRYVHILVCEAFHGPAPEGKPWALHWDDNPLNLDKDNLRWGSEKDNAEDAKRNGNSAHHTKTHCPFKHPLSGENLSPGARVKGWRRCRVCDQERAQSKRDGRPFDPLEADRRLENMKCGQGG